MAAAAPFVPNQTIQPVLKSTGDGTLAGADATGHTGNRRPVNTTRVESYGARSSWTVVEFAVAAVTTAGETLPVIGFQSSARPLTRNVAFTLCGRLSVLATK